MRHIIDNATSCMGTAMGADWDIFVKGLTAACNVCRKPFLRDRLKSSCFDSEPAKDSWHKFEDFKSIVYEGRWSSISCAALDLEPLMIPLRFAWSIEKWNRNGKLPEATAETRWRVDSAHLNDTLRSDVFWATLNMACRLSRIIEGMVSFASSCPCHSCRASFMAEVDANKGVFAEASFDLGYRGCPMSGRVVPEIVAGEFDELVKELCAQESSTFRMTPIFVQLTQAQQVALILMFDRGSEALIFYVKVKVGAYRQLPLKIAGMAHPHVHIARQIAEMCLDMFVSNADGAEHAESKYIFVDLRSDIDQFILDGHISVLLKKRLGRYRILQVNETSLEGLHAVLHRHYTRSNHVGSNHVGICTHLPEIKRALEMKHLSMEDLASHCQKDNLFCF